MEGGLDRPVTRMGQATKSERRVPFVLLVALATATFVAPQAGAGDEEPKREVRHVKARYESPAIGWQRALLDRVLFRNCLPDDRLGCVGFVAGEGELIINVKIEDRLGLPVPGAVDAEHDYVPFCGKTTKPVFVEPGTETFVWVFVSTGTHRPPLCPAPATQGVIKATFSNRR